MASVTFYVKKPSKPKYPWPATAPDLSKLLRSTEDALKDAGVIADDSRIVEYTSLQKRYASPGQLPGAFIQVREFVS